MKPYETIKFITAPDVGDIKSQARKSSIGRFPEKGGDYKSYTRSAKSRKETRRYLKRSDKARVAREWENEDV